MKRIITCMAMAYALGLYAEPTDNDTIVINKPQSVSIITGDSIQTIEVKGREGDEGYHYQNSIQLVDDNYVSKTTINHDRWTLGVKMNSGDDNRTRNELVMKFALGMVNAINCDEGVDFSTTSSIELMWTIAQYNHYFDPQEHHRLSVGFALDWRNYRMTGNTMFDKDENGHIITTGYPTDANPKFSRFKVLSLAIPFEYCYKISPHFGFGFGPVLNWNVYGSMKTKYKLDGGTHKFVDKDIHQRVLTIDWMLRVYNPIISFYVKYSPMDVLKSDWGPKFQSISFGIDF